MLCSTLSVDGLVVGKSAGYPSYPPCPYPCFTQSLYWLAEFLLTFNHESIRSQGAMADRVTSRSLTTLLNYVIQAFGERRDHGRGGPVISRPGIDITSY